MLHTGDNFGSNVAFVNAFVRQHRLTDDIADSEDVRHVGTQLFINADKATLVNFNACFTGIEVFTVRHAADSHQHGVVALSFSRGFFAFHGNVDTVFFRFNGGHFGFQHQVEFLTDALGEDFHHVFIGSRDNLVEHFNHVNL